MQEIGIDVSSKLYDLEAVYKACYRFMDAAYVRLEGDPENKISVRIRPKSGEIPEHQLRGEFENELLHQALRLKVARANAKLREHIVTCALASAEGAPAKLSEKERGPALDEDLEKEIEKLLAEVEKEGGEDPLKILAPSDEKNAPPKASNSPQGA